MRNLNHIEEIHENIDTAKGLRLTEDDDIRDALVASAGDDFTLVPGEGIYGNTIDIIEFEEMLTIKKNIGYYAAR